MMPDDMRNPLRTWQRAAAMLAAVTLGSVCALATTARAQDCMVLLGLFQQGRTDLEVARMTGLGRPEVNDCRRQLSRPIVVGPSGVPPVGAAGPAPRGAAGPPPVGAAGPPPVGAAGPPPVGHEVQRLP